MVNPERPPLFLTTAELASILRIHSSTVVRDAANDRIPGAVKHGSRWRFRRADVEQWLGVELCERPL